MPERLFWTAIPTSWCKAFLGNSVTFFSSDSYLLWNPNMILCSIYKNQSWLNQLDTLLTFLENSHRACWVHQLRSDLLLGRCVVRLSSSLKPAVTTAVFVVLIMPG